MKYPYLILQLFWLFTFLPAQAQDLEIPFVFYGKKMLIQVFINDKNTPETFVFDTGASSTVLDSVAAQHLGVQANHTQSAVGASGQKTYRFAVAQKIWLDQENSVEPINFILADLERLQQLNGKHFAGVIGKDLLDRYAVHIDFEKKLLQLYKNGEDFKPKGYEKLAFDFGGQVGIPQFEVKLGLQNGETYQGRVFMDSGAGLSLLINTRFKETNQLQQKVGKVLESQSTGLSHQASTLQARVKSLSFGSYVFEDFCLSLSSDKSGVNAFSGYLGILGIDFLKRFHIFLDYRHKALYLKPNQFYHEAFETPRSGLRLIKKEEIIYIESVSPGTPAAQLGLEAEDQILAVDEYTGRDLEEYRQQLRKEVEQVKIKVQKMDGRVMELTLPMKKLL